LKALKCRSARGGPRTSADAAGVARAPSTALFVPGRSSSTNGSSSRDWMNSKTTTRKSRKEWTTFGVKSGAL